MIWLVSIFIIVLILLLTSLTLFSSTLLLSFNYFTAKSMIIKSLSNFLHPFTALVHNFIDDDICHRWCCSCAHYYFLFILVSLLTCLPTSLPHTICFLMSLFCWTIERRRIANFMFLQELQWQKCQKFLMLFLSTITCCHCYSITTNKAANNRRREERKK